MSKFVPLRKFIFDRLYHPTQGYFCKRDFQVGELSHPIDFKKLVGFDDYQEELFKRYPKNAWLTPSQIFKPYYGMSIGNYINQAVQKYPKSKKIKIVEAGAGTGSAAESILFYFQNFHQEKFHNIEYNIVEISPALCSHMEAKLKKSYPWLLENKQIKIINQDISNYSSPNQICFMLFFEVLDNLPHDKVIKNPQLGKYDKFSIVNLDTKQQQFKGIEADNLIKECLQFYLKTEKFTKEVGTDAGKGVLNYLATKVFDRYYKKTIDDSQLFLPTNLLQLLKSIKKNVPRAHLVISDFDYLMSSVTGKYAPIVSTKGQKSAQKKDHDTYLVNRGQADIFFPTDFNFVKMMHKGILGRDAEVVKSYQFFEEFSHQKWAVSKSGFNPIREDFGNTSFLVTKI